MYSLFMSDAASLQRPATRAAAVRRAHSAPYNVNSWHHTALSGNVGHYTLIEYILYIIKYNSNNVINVGHHTLMRYILWIIK